jgi:hypothetical protein
LQRLNEQACCFLLDGLGEIQFGLLDAQVLHLLLEDGQILLAHPNAHTVHCLHDDLPAVAQH